MAKASIGYLREGKAGEQKKKKSKRASGARTKEIQLPVALPKPRAWAHVVAHIRGALIPIWARDIREVFVLSFFIASCKREAIVRGKVIDLPLYLKLVKSLYFGTLNNNRTSLLAHHARLKMFLITIILHKIRRNALNHNSLRRQIHKETSHLASEGQRVYRRSHYSPPAAVRRIQHRW